MKHTVSAKRNSRSSATSTSGAHRSSSKLVVCVDNEGYAASLERRKIYRALRDDAAAEHGMIRVIDESGEDYLFPEKLFVPVQLPKPVERTLMGRG